MHSAVEVLSQLLGHVPESISALRRVDAGGGMTEEQEEEPGATLLALHARMTELCEEHGYTLEELNLDLGPPGCCPPPPGGGGGGPP
ncbi:gas vesicle protein GvpK, partial [Streptomyces sp. NPDC002122]|uniref:gas vesicle protein GvpK n=1 Tax=Streptomyces sp. NPDC002122 TaxID=3154407 RepID=UPI0033302BB8